MRNTQRMIDGDFARDVTFTPVLRLKDVDYALRLADTARRRARRSAPRPAKRFARLSTSAAATEHEGRVIEVGTRHGCSNVAASSRRGQP